MATSTHGFRTKFHGSTSASLAEMKKGVGSSKASREKMKQRNQPGTLEPSKCHLTNPFPAQTAGYAVIGLREKSRGINFDLITRSSGNQFLEQLFTGINLVIFVAGGGVHQRTAKGASGKGPRQKH